MTARRHPKNDFLRELVGVAKRTAGDNRGSQYLKDALDAVKQTVASWRSSIRRAEEVLALPPGDPRRLGAVQQAQKDRDDHKDALADALDIQFELENWMSPNRGP